MRFDPKAPIDTSRVDDTGAGGPLGGGRARLPIPTTAGGGKLGLLLLVLGFVLRWFLSRRSSRALG